MNVQEMDVVKALHRASFVNQRELAKRMECSLGVVNRTLKSLEEHGYLDDQHRLTDTALEALRQNVPQRAVILAAGFGMRMVPINMESPKALIQVKGEPLIERLIKQLHEVHVQEIYVVVGFMKEQFEYLIDDFGVNLVVNNEYASTNNLHSLNFVRQKLANAYILPCDIWCRENPFSCEEFYSWYMVKDSQTEKSEVRVSRQRELVKTKNNEPGNPMIGISYITAEDAPVIQDKLAALSQNTDFDQSFWEEALYEKGRMTVLAKVVPAASVVEINTYEQLRELDSDSEQLQSEAISTVCQALSAKPSEIKEITILKKGMTNRSFRFTCRGKQYIMRIPGEGTDLLINRREEAAVYQAIRAENLCDDIVYINPDNGYKITQYLENARVCDAFDETDIRRCMEFLKQFHRKGLVVDHEFDLWGKIDFYESLWNGLPSVYRDYKHTKETVFSLRSYIDSHAEQKTLTHIDAVPDNFLLFDHGSGEEEIRLIDWEYAAMQDPHVDIAMFSIYALYSKEQIDHLIDVYFENQCAQETRVKIYCYVAVCGLLWSNWCEYKRNLGVEFGEYSIRQYRYAKEFYRYATEAMEAL